MTFKEIKLQSKKQLMECRFRVIVLIALAAAAELFFVFAKLVFADFLLLNYLKNPARLIISPQNSVLVIRAAFYFSKTVVTTLLLAKALGIFCSKEHFGTISAKTYFSLVILRLIISAAKLPHLVCFYVVIVFGKKMLFEYNAQPYELAISVLMLLAALCLVLMYIYFAMGLFVSPLLIFRGENVLDSISRSLDMMKKKRARLLRLFLCCLPEAVLIFTLPQIAMRFAVFANDCAYFYYEDA